MNRFVKLHFCYDCSVEFINHQMNIKYEKVEINILLFPHLLPVGLF